MGKIEKCLYIVELLSRNRPMSLREINRHWEYSSLYDGEIIPKSFGRYREYVSAVFAIDIECDKRTSRYYIANPDYIGNNVFYKYLLSAFYVEALVELPMKYTDYELPLDVRKKLGYDIFKFDPFQYESFQSESFEYEIVKYDPCDYERLDMVVLERGLIGVRRVGYI